MDWKCFLFSLPNIGSILGASGGNARFCEMSPHGEGLRGFEKIVILMDLRILWYCSTDWLSRIPPGMGFDLWF